MGNEEVMVAIPLYRYEALLDKVTRQDVLTNYIVNNNYVDRKTMLQILGNYSAAGFVKEQEEKERQSFSITKDVEGVTEDAGTD